MADVTHRRARLYRFEPFELDVRAGELRKHGIRLRLREQPLRILLLLLERPGDVILRTEIRDKLWPNQTVVEFDHGINAAIRKLRDALGESAEQQRYLETVARRGYRFLGQVEVVEDPVSEPPPPAVHETDELEGKRVSHYLVFDKLGSGGMGVVFRARDLTLKRNVALKFLSEDYSRHRQSLERFQQEAQAAAALNHANICTVYEIGEHASRPFIAMELLEGQALHDLLAERPLPLEEMVALAIQTASALNAAHRGGIIHRDIKPANLFVTRRGRVKILDFGLAKLLPEGLPDTTPAAPLEEDGEASVAGQQTRPNSPVGTVAYMSPEQVRGEAVDPRSDIFSLGVVLYEMAGGKRAFRSGSSAETMSAILSEDPPDLPSRVPPVLVRIVRRSMEKQPAQRFQSAAELGLALQSVPSALPARVPTASRAWIATTALLATLLAVLAALHFREKPGRPPAVQFSIFPPAGLRFGEVRYGGPPLISPDGSKLVFAGVDERGTQQLWVRPLGSLTARALPGTEGAWYPFWSPDSRWLGFFVGRKLKKISVESGPPETLANAGCCGGAWARTEDGGAGVMVFPMEHGEGLARIPAAGGEPVRITWLDPTHKEEGHYHPQFLPDGRHFLFVASTDRADHDTICVGDASRGPGSGNVRRIARGMSHAWWAPPGYVLLVRDNNLMAQAFDMSRLTLTGEPFLVAEHVGNGFNRHTSDFSVSATGVLAWRGDFNADRQLAWFDRSGRQLAGLDVREPYVSPRLSPAGDRIALIRLDTPVIGSDRNQPESSLTRNIWLMDPGSGAVTAFTFGAAVAPGWSPDGSRIVFGHGQGPDYGLYWKSVRGAGSEELLLKTATQSTPLSWSPDGRFIAYLLRTLEPSRDLFVLPLIGERRPIPVARDNLSADFSPDGRWIAYSSGEAGRLEVSVRSFGAPDAQGPWQVTTNGGMNPRWRRDGRELFYVAIDRRLMAVPVNAHATFKNGPPAVLFDPHDHNPTEFEYDVSADGQRFLISRLVEDDSRPVNIALDWLAMGRK